MIEEFFRERLTQLRISKGVSARDMSLTLGQSESYINKIENGKAFPSMQVFFYICEYFGISPLEFFDTEIINPVLVNKVMREVKQLSDDDLILLSTVLRRINP